MHQQRYSSIDFVYTSVREKSSLEPLYNEALAQGVSARLLKIKKPWFFTPAKPYKETAPLIYLCHDRALERLKKKGWKGEYIFIDHGISPVKYWTFKYSFFHHAALLFYPGEVFKRQMASVNPGFKNGLLSGYPKCDELVTMDIDRAKLIDYYNLDATKPIILFAPSWGKKEGTGITNALFFKEIQNVIVAPHSADYKKALEYGFKLPPNQGNINALMHLADIVISDISSIVGEAALIGKTTIQLRLLEYPGCFPSPDKRTKGIWVSEQRIKEEEAKADVANHPFKIAFLDEDWDFGYSCTPQKMKETIEEAISHPQKHIKQAQYWAEQSCYKCTDGKISQRIVSMVKQFMHDGSRIQE